MIDPEELAEQLYDNPMREAQEFPVEQEVVIDEQDTNHRIWKKIESWANERINQLRQENDIYTTEKAAVTRCARIAQLKELLSLGQGPELNSNSDSPDDPNLGY